MVLDPISNASTKQGSIFDVERLFDIQSEFNPCNFTYDQLENLVANSSLAYQVAYYYPERLANMELQVQTRFGIDDEDATAKLDWIRDRIRGLPREFKQAQEKANIFGEAYVTFTLKGLDEGHIEVSRQNLDEISLKFDETYTTNSHLLLPESGLLVSRQLLLNINSVMDKFLIDTPLAEGIPTMPVPKGLGDTILLQKDLDFLTAVDRHMKLVNSSPETFDQFVIDWFPPVIKADGTPETDLPYNPRYREHLLRPGEFLVFKAFGYQPNPNNDNPLSARHRSGQTIEQELASGSDQVTSNTYNDGGFPVRHSYQLVRFIRPLVHYLSFKNAVLNKAHHWEFLHYQKEGLSRAQAEALKQDREQMPTWQQWGTGSLARSSEAEKFYADLRREMTEMLLSSVNSGVVLTDKSNALDVITRTFSGVLDAYKIFKDELIAASGLTEFALFRLSDVGGGLASEDQKNRLAEATTTSNLFVNHWLGRIEAILKQLSRFIGWDIDAYGTLTLNYTAPFNLTESEKTVDLDTRLKLRLDLFKEGVLTRDELRAELLSNQTAIGRDFMLDIELPDEEYDAYDEDYEEVDEDDGDHLAELQAKDTHLKTVVELLIQLTQAGILTTEEVRARLMDSHGHLAYALGLVAPDVSEFDRSPPEQPDEAFEQIEDDEPDSQIDLNEILPLGNGELLTQLPEQLDNELTLNQR